MVELTILGMTIFISGMCLVVGVLLVNHIKKENPYSKNSNK